MAALFDFNLDTPVQLHTTTFQTTDPTGARDSSYLFLVLVGGDLEHCAC